MIVVADALHEAGVELLRRCEFECAFADSSRGELMRLLPRATALIVRSATVVDEHLLSLAPRLLVVGRAGVGLDHIDLASADRRGISVVNTPDANTLSAAEHTVGMLLACVRSIPAADAQLKAGLFQRAHPAGFELAGKVLGIVGLGRIGGKVARLMQGFGMQVLATDPYIGSDRFRDHGVEAVECLEELAARVRVLSVHTPLDEQTRGLISASVIARLPRGAVLVNCARGGIVDEAALLEGLVSGHVAAAACDVFVGEPVVGGEQLSDATSARLAAHPRLVATPHLGARTEEAQRRMSLHVVEAVLDVLRTASTR